MAEQRKLKSQFFCDLAAMDAEQSVRYHHVTQHMLAATPVIEELADGYALRFGVDSSLYLKASNNSCGWNWDCSFKV